MNIPEAQSPTATQPHELSSHPSHPKLREVLAAPWIGIRNPSAAADIMHRSSPAAWWLSIELCYALASVVIILIAWWSLTLTDDLLPAPQANLAAQQRTWADAWILLTERVELHVRVAYVFLIGNFLAQPILVAAQLSRIPLAVPTRARISMSASAVASAVGFGLAAAILALAIAVFVRRWDLWINGNSAWVWYLSDGALAVFVGYLCIDRSATAVESLVHKLPAPPDPPRCEECGYDLTYTSETLKCTECGSELADSLDQSRSRPNPEWEHRRNILSFAITTCRVLIGPQEFYRRLSVCTLGQSRLFADVHYRILAAFLTAFVVWDAWRDYVAYPGLNLWRLVAGAVANALVLLLPIWLVHRIAGLGALAVASTWYVRAGGARISHLVDYEAASLVPTLAFILCGTELVNQFTYGVLATRVPGATVYAGLAMLVLAVLIPIVWGWRFWIAIRAIRYANF